MKKHEAFPSKYIKTQDLDGREWTVTIERVLEEIIKKEDGTEDRKPVVYFQKSQRGWVLNQTNWDAVEALHGEDSNDWLGKKVTLYPSKTKFGPKTVDCIRVKPNGPIPKHQKAAMDMTEDPAEGMDDEIPF